YVTFEREHLVEPTPPLAQIATRLPEGPEGSGKLHPGGGILVLDGPAEGRSQVVVLLVQSRQPQDLLRATECGRPFLGKLRKVRRVATCQRLLLASARQALRGVLVNGLQQHEARLA